MSLLATMAATLPLLLAAFDFILCHNDPLIQEIELK